METAECKVRGHEAVAVIIPTLNRGPFLKGALESAFGCDPPPDEVVVVDCGSTDDTAAIVRDSRRSVRFLPGRRRNVAEARNAGVSASSAPLIAFLDSDDIALPGKTGGLAAALDERPRSVMVHGTLRVIDAEGRPSQDLQTLQDGMRARTLKQGTTYVDLAHRCWAFTSATMIRRSAFERIGGYDESIDAYEDWDLYLRLSLEGTIDHVDTPSCCYRIWPGNVAWERHTQGVAAVARKHLGLLAQMNIAGTRKAELAFRTRLAGALYTLVELRSARHEATRALRLDPIAALREPEIRRALLRSFLPPAVLERRRQPRASS